MAETKEKEIQESLDLDGLSLERLEEEKKKLLVKRDIKRLQEELSEEVKVPIITKIQNELKAPKSQKNTFGNYNYRNAEDIEEALKPLLLKCGASLYVDEETEVVGNRIYIVAVAHYKDQEREITVRSHAREPEIKKGMDESQITGSSSSYATKYALQKLFLIDDNKDADSEDNSSQGTTSSYQKQQPKYSKQSKGYGSYPQAKRTQTAQSPYQDPNAYPQTPPQKDVHEVKSFDEVKKYQVKYPDKHGSEITLEEIWNKAVMGDLEASGWWRDTQKLNNSDGVAVKAYTEYFNRAKKKKQTA